MDRIRCISCGSESYNDFGKTALHCNSCYTALQTSLTEAQEENKRLRNTLEKIRNTDNKIDIYCIAREALEVK